MNRGECGRQSNPTGGTTSAATIKEFAYPACSPDEAAPLWNGYPDAGGEFDDETRTAAQSDPRQDWEKRLAEETRKAFESGRERALEEAREAGREALTNARDQQERRLTGVMEGFAAARDHYLNAVEHEVVKLALAIAARILRREAQMDPLLLTGAVRVALGQLAATTEVKLRVPASDLELWREAIAHVPNLAVKPEVLAGEGMRLGDCAIESSLGNVDVGIGSQLGEIERGFFDRAGGATGGEAPKAISAMPETRR